MPTGTLFFGLAVVTYGLIVLGVAEWLVARLSRGLAIRGRRHELFSSQIAPFAIVACFVGDAMAWIDLGISWWPGPILLLAGTSLLWATRFVREPVLVYLGLWNLAGGMMELARREFAGERHPGLLFGWLAIASRCIALAYWLAGTLVRHHQNAEEAGPRVPITGGRGSRRAGGRFGSPRGSCPRGDVVQARSAGASPSHSWNRRRDLPGTVPQYLPRLRRGGVRLALAAQDGSRTPRSSWPHPPWRSTGSCSS